MIDEGPIPDQADSGDPWHDDTERARYFDAENKRDALARVAHAAAVQYSREMGGRDTEPWEELPERWRELWRRAAAAVKEVLKHDRV